MEPSGLHQQKESRGHYRKEKTYKKQKTQVESDAFFLPEGRSFNIRDDLIKPPHSVMKQETRHSLVKGLEYR